MYLVFKENIQIATLLKRGNKSVDIKFSAHERFWNNLHQVAQNRQIFPSLLIGVTPVLSVPKDLYITASWV